MMMLINDAEETVSVVCPAVPLPACVALIVVTPPETGVTSPLEPDALLTVATVLIVDFQVTCVVRS